MSSVESLSATVASAVAAYEKAIGHVASRTHQMIESLGPVEALSRLMASGDIQKGFKVLCATGQKHKSFEAAVIDHEDLFPPEIVEAARWRLDQAPSGG